MRIDSTSNRTGTYPLPNFKSPVSEKSDSTSEKAKDKVVISMQYRTSNEEQNAVGETGAVSNLTMESARKALKAEDTKELRSWMETWKKENQLEVNWDAAVDPDGSIYATAYIESLVSQYEKQRTTIEAYYAESHKENCSSPYGNDLRGGLMYLAAKYQEESSIYFRSDMSEEERAMSYYQERALLMGSSVSLNDPYALASTGGVPGRKEADRIAEQAAREKLNGLISEAKGNREK